MRKPNIIYILADDMGYGDISYLNEKCPFETKYFDQIGREGMNFIDAHSTSAVCTPSRYGILTGRYNWRSRLKSGVVGGYTPHLIEDGRQTVANVLSDAGYYTACIGKWHLGMDWACHGEFKNVPNFGVVENVDYSQPIKNGPIDFGFQYYYGISGSLDMPPYVYIENNRVVELPTHITSNTGKMFWREGPTAPGFKHEQVLPELTDKVLETIEQHKEEPFFIYFPIPAPHTPILPTKDWQGISGTNEYGDFVMMCDAMIGKVLEKVKACGIEEDTIIIYTSDNGCSPSADYGELAAKGHNPSYIFRGTKADIYEGGHRIPLLIKWPRIIKAGSICKEPVCLVDFMATVAEILEVYLPDHMGEDSVSELDLWKGGATYEREAVVHQSIDGSLSIRKGKYKLEMCKGSGGWSAPMPGSEEEAALDSFQLYDLEEDIREQHNIYSQYPEIVEELKNLLVKYVKEGRSTPGSPQANNGKAVWPTISWIEEE
ncbi:arylsulfatase [Niameybacter massiliensis]|uniref:Arylsulfatase n=1 Tax=Holtiella tumoricola TaxID=3018743 RepID=A0AA42DL10_9FIRM|nr:arylsulfatase [Holtiella tumoricola]MDA3730827.1 arylsulfatase [Holtiella tumoricola]